MTGHQIPVNSIARSVSKRYYIVTILLLSPSRLLRKSVRELAIAEERRKMRILGASELDQLSGKTEVDKPLTIAERAVLPTNGQTPPALKVHVYLT